jgi:2-methylcitrate dehydratase PrpD
MNSDIHVTEAIAARAAGLRFADLPENARTVAKQCLLDFVGVTIAARDEPLVRILLDDIDEAGGHAQASLVGLGRFANAEQAALVNGAAGHAHDYDDVHLVMNGHPTVPVMPAVLALAEQHGRSGADLLAAFAAGVDTECLLGRYLGQSHYDHGWHATGTLGAFGAAAASAHLLGLDTEATARALGIAGTQAAGLKSQFGTMVKPLHAGHAAATGLTAARLARRGFSSRTNLVETEQGFAATQSTSADGERFARGLDVESYVPDICFKYHAACYLTHSAITATRQLVDAHAIRPDEVNAATLTVPPGHFRVCHIPEPTTGLEIKFSLRMTTAMALAGRDTSAIDAFTDTLAHDPELVRLRDRVNVVARDDARRDTHVRIDTPRGVFERELDVGIPARDLDAQWSALARKFHALVAPRLGDNATSRIEALCRTLETQSNLDEFFSLIRGHA